MYDELENVIGGRQAEELRQCLDIEKYGRILQQGYNAEFTEYGMVTRDDFQSMDAPWQYESEVMDMQITLKRRACVKTSPSLYFFVHIVELRAIEKLRKCNIQRVT